MSSVAESTELENGQHMDEITIKGIGPIREVFTLPFPDEGGVIEIHGNQGVGKSTILRTVNRMTGGGDDLSVNDDCSKGEAAGFGVTLTLGKSARIKGAVAFAVLDDRFPLRDLADPGIADPDAADRHRIKALVKISGVPADVSQFDAVIDPADRAEILKPDTLKKDDFVAMAASIKRDLEAAARNAENVAENLEGKSQASKAAADGADLEGEADSAKLSAALEEAIRYEQKLQGQATAHANAKAAAKQASDRVAELEAEYDGLSVATAQQFEADEKNMLATIDVEVKEIEAKLIEARDRQTDRRNRVARCIAATKAAEHHADTIAKWRAQIDKSIPLSPDESERTNALDQVVAARLAIEAGALIRQAREQLAAAKEHTVNAGRYRKRAESLRNAAKGTDEVLSAIVSKCSDTLRVGTGKHSGRLVLDTDRGEELFAELSEGERAEQALLVAIKAVGNGGVITIPQVFWDGLSETTRARLHAKCQEFAIRAYAATVSTGPLRARLFGVNGGGH